MRVNRLDKVQYKNNIAYVDHISEVGFTPTTWLYGIPEEARETICTDEPVDMKDVVKLERKTDYRDFLTGKFAIYNLFPTDEQELIEACKNANIDISNADVDCYYKKCWYIKNNELKTVQSFLDARDDGVEKYDCSMIEYIRTHEME